MSVKTAILLSPEIKQSAVETKVYDQGAQFYEYFEFEENKTIVEAGNHSRKKGFLKTALVTVGGFCLLTIFAAAIYFSLEKLSPQAAINRLGAENLPKSESGGISFGEDEQNAFEQERSVKPDLPDAKEDSLRKEILSGKEILNSTDPKTIKISEQTEKTPPLDRNSKELPKTISPIPVNVSSKTSNSNFTKQNVLTSEAQVARNDSRRVFRTGLPSIKNSQNEQTSLQNRRDAAMPVSSGGFRKLPQNRPEFIAKKIKQSNNGQRSNIKDRLQNQSRKN